MSADGAEASPFLTEPAPNPRPQSLQWEVVGLGAPLGLLVAFVTIVGIGSVWWEGVAWAVVGFAWIGLVWWQQPPQPFLHGFLASFAGGSVAILLQAVFIDAFLASHPALEASLAVRDISPRWFVVGTGLLGSALTGVLVGMFAAFSSPSRIARDEA